MLSNSGLLKALTLINFYEYSFGLISGIVVNYLYETFFPFVKNEPMIKSVPLLFILIIPIITIFVYLRQYYINYLPILKNMNLKKHENFSHPPPIAFAFGFWQTQEQLKLRNDRFTKRLSHILKL